jgi:hypothetical protein
MPKSHDLRFGFSAPYVRRVSTFSARSSRQNRRGFPYQINMFVEAFPVAANASIPKSRDLCRRICSSGVGNSQNFPHIRAAGTDANSPSK